MSGWITRRKRRHDDDDDDDDFSFIAQGGKDSDSGQSVLQENKQDTKEKQRPLSDYDRRPERPDSGKPVRGKKRKGLPAYTCCRCEGFYKAANMTEAEINAVSRHRGVKPPPSPPGYWNPGWISPEKKNDG